MTIFQERMPICRRCGKLHGRRLEYTWASYCQQCDDEWTVEQFAVAPATQAMTEAQLVEFIRVKRPGLFERGVMPDYLFAYLWAKVAVENGDYRS